MGLLGKALGKSTIPTAWCKSRRSFACMESFSRQNKNYSSVESRPLTGKAGKTEQKKGTPGRVSELFFNDRRATGVIASIALGFSLFSEPILRH